jgi:hypothetical protein
MNTRLGLAEAVQSLRLELQESIYAGVGQDLLFEVGEIEIQLQVELVRETEEHIGIKAWVIETGIGGKGSTTRGHVITIPLLPVDETGHRVLTGRSVVRRPK